MSMRRRYLWLVALAAFVLAALPSIASSEPLPVEAVNEGGIYGETHRWSNVPQTIAVGEKVTFSNPTAVLHGVEWRSALKASCEEGPGQVPVGTTSTASGTKWSGKCTFSQAGTYTFYCTVHGAAMNGTITVTNPGEPNATTQAATSVTEHEVTLNGTVNPNGKATKYFFKWGPTEGYGQQTGEQSAGEGTTGIPVSAKLSGLSPGTTYHFQLVAENSTGTTKGADQVFTTPGPPSATTNAATAVSETEATLKGTVNPDGKLTKYFFEWGTSEGYGQMTTEASAGEEGHFNQPASAKLTGLVAGTVYHFRLVAKNASEEVRGGDQMFTTTSLSSPPSEPPPPTTTTTTASPLPPTTTTHAEPPPGTPPAGSPSVRSTQRGTSVKGSLNVSTAGAGGRLEVDLLAKGASLAVHRSSQVRVGRLVRASVSAGKVSFSVALTARAKSALRRHHRLALTVKITLTPTHGTAVSIARSVTLRS